MRDLTLSDRRIYCDKIKSAAAGIVAGLYSEVRLCPESLSGQRTLVRPLPPPSCTFSTCGRAYPLSTKFFLRGGVIPLPSCAVGYVSHSICKQEEPFVAIRARIDMATYLFISKILALCVAPRFSKRMNYIRCCMILNIYLKLFF